MEMLINKTIGLSLLILIILLIRPLVLRYLNASVAYGLWLMLPLFLILPASFLEQTVNSPVMTFFPESKLLLSSINTENILSDAGFGFEMFFIWLAGLIFSIGLYYVRFHKLNVSLNEFNYQLPSQQLTHNANFKTHLIEIKNTPLVDVPAVFGLFKGFLILPKAFISLSEEKQLMILRHEFYHLARHDHQINCLRVLIKSLFWFNPLFYWADKVVEADQEISCDLGVLKNSPQTEKINYASALIESVSGMSQNYLVSQWKYQSLIKERIKMLKYTNQKKWHKWAAAGLAVTSIWTASLVVAGEKTQSGDAIPMVVIEPKYPIKALKEGVEGYVRFNMNVDSNGQPYDIKVIESMPKAVFEIEATKAITKWNFKPKVSNGVAVNQNNIEYTMEFKLGGEPLEGTPPPPPKPELK